MIRFIILLLPILLIGCDKNNVCNKVYGNSRLVVKAQNKIETTEGTVFKDTTLYLYIDWYDESTKEITFLEQVNVLEFHEPEFFLGDDAKTPFSHVTAYSSIAISDLVLCFFPKKTYLSFGYPVTCSGCEEIRKENRLKRSGEWNRFIELLKKEEKYRK